MKYAIAIAIALLTCLALGLTVPNSMAPQPFQGLEIQQAPNSPETKEPEVSATSSFAYERSETDTLFKLLEIAVEEDRDLKKATELIRDAHETQHNAKLLELYQAKIFSRSLDFEKAGQLLDTVDDDELTLLKAAVLIASGDRDRSGAYLHDLVDSHQDPHIKLTALSLLNIYYRYDHHREADESYLWTLFAQKLGELNELEISLYLAQKAIDKEPSYRDAWIIKGYNELSLKRPEDAETSLLTAYRLDPGNAQVQYLLGVTYAEQSDYELSNQYLLYAKQNETPYQISILERLAENTIALEDFPLAHHYYRKLISLKPNHAYGLSRLVWILTEKLQQYEEAAEHANRYIVSFPNDPQGYHLLSWVFSQQGKLEDAMIALQEAKRLETSPY